MARLWKSFHQVVQIIHEVYEQACVRLYSLSGEECVKLETPSPIFSTMPNVFVSFMLTLALAQLKLPKRFSRCKI